MKLNTKQLTVTGIMLAICIVSQFFKNTSVFITGPIVNCALIITTLYCGIVAGTVLSVITPVSAFIITGNPIMSALPLIIPCVMIGNEILVLAIEILKNRVKNEKYAIVSGILLGAVIKFAFMTLFIVKLILPYMGADKLPAAIISVASTTFSTTQLITALIGGALAMIIWPIIKIDFKND